MSSGEANADEGNTLNTHSDDMATKRQETLLMRAVDPCPQAVEQGSECLSSHGRAEGLQQALSGALNAALCNVNCATVVAYCFQAPATQCSTTRPESDN